MVGEIERESRRELERKRTRENKIEGERKCVTESRSTVETWYSKTVPITSFDVTNSHGLKIFKTVMKIFS